MKEAILDRFLRYVAVTSQSDGKAGVVPSTEGQRKLAGMLAEELAELGFVNIEISEYSVLTALLPGNLPDNKAVPTVGWCCHLDTVDAGLSPDVHPQVIRGYQGGDICLNKEKDLWMRTSEHPEIEKYVGDDIVVTDGTSVLGADNKSAIANVMTAFDIVVKENRPHGDIYVAFVPDEEIGLLGAKKIDFSKFPVDFAYTVDCCELGEVVYETFNAGSATIRIKGVTAHPMSSKGVLVNPTLIATDFVQMMDRGSTPECTEGTEGFVWVNSIVSNPSQATVSIKIRDHNREKYEAKKALIASAVEYLKVRNPRARIELEVKDMYGNIADALTDDNRCAVDHLYRALEIAGVKANTISMRGGTDGSFISTQGVITPNYFTGGHNFHSNCEFLPLGAAVKSTEVTLTLIDLIAGTKH